MKIVASFLVGFVLAELVAVGYRLQDVDRREGVILAVTVTATPSPTPLPSLEPSPSPTPPPSPSPSPQEIIKPTILPTPTPTPSPSPPPTTFTSQQINEFIDQFAAQYAIDPNKLRHIAICESGFNPEATNGPNVGLYQFTAGTWEKYRKLIHRDVNPQLRLHAGEAVQTAAYVLSVGQGYIWPECNPE